MGAAANLLSDLSGQIQLIQQDIMGQIQQATMAGDFAKVQELMKEMEQKIRTLVDSHSNLELVVDNTESPIELYNYSSPHSELNLNEIVFHQEREIYTRMQTNENMTAIKEHVQKFYPAKDIRKSLMRDHLKLDLALSPKLAEVVSRCREALKIKTEVQVFLVNSLEVNAYCPPPTDSHIYICITSSLLEKLNVDELCYVFGHEIGHALMNHHEIPLQQILNNPRFEIKPEELLEIFTWKRSAEVTCDRFGLICGTRFENAARGVFKIYYGLSELGDDSIYSYMKNFGDINSEITISPADYYSTHPFGPVRLIALQYFSLSENFHRIMGTQTHEINDTELTQRMNAIMKIYDVNQVSPEAQHAIDKYFMISAISIAASDGEVSPDELLKMKELCKTPNLMEELMPLSYATVAELQEQIQIASQQIYEYCSVPQKLNLIRNLTCVAVADGILTDTERSILYYCSEFAGVDPKFVDDTLSDMAKLT